MNPADCKKLIARYKSRVAWRRVYYLKDIISASEKAKQQVASWPEWKRKL